MPQKRRSTALFKALATAAMILVLLNSAWAGSKYQVLHAFTGGNDGGGLWGSLLLDQGGNIYGTTVSGGPKGKGGTVFKLAHQANGTWAESVLYNFCSQSGCRDGGGSTAGLTFDAAGNLYGTTQSGKLGRNCALQFPTPPRRVLSLRRRCDGQVSQYVWRNILRLRTHARLQRLESDHPSQLYR
jgi:hypothetical protein